MFEDEDTCTFDCRRQSNIYIVYIDICVCGCVYIYIFIYYMYIYNMYIYNINATCSCARLLRCQVPTDYYAPHGRWLQPALTWLTWFINLLDGVINQLSS